MLELRGVESYYGNSQVLFGVDLICEQSKVTTLIGRNGMGKTTTIRSIMGINPIRQGDITFNAQPIHGKAVYEIAQMGIGLVPEGRQVFSNLTVKENLIATAANYKQSIQPWNLEQVLDMFPQLAQRIHSMGSHLSGGEQQMLAIGRALMLNPVLLILDEATEGLAPKVRQEIWECLSQLKQSGLSILIVDKNIDELNHIADRHNILEKGQVVWQGDAQALAEESELKSKYLGV